MKGSVEWVRDWAMETRGLSSLLIDLLRESLSIDFGVSMCYSRDSVSFSIPIVVLSSEACCS